jgi:hypothetical protein
VVSVDGKLIPFAYPANAKSPKIYQTINENGTIRLNTNPIDNEHMQENFYHTLSPFTTHSQYEECQNLCERPMGPSCPVHHRLVNYASDTLPLKISANNNKKSENYEPSQPFAHLHYHHGTCQRQCKAKGMISPLVNKGL